MAKVWPWEDERKHDIFAREAFTFLLNYPPETDAHRNFRMFTRKMGLTLVTVGYVWRKQWWVLFRKSRVNFEDINAVQEFAKRFKPVKDEIYFFRLLLWIAQLFELVKFYLGEEQAYLEAARKTLAEEISELYFYENDGYERLQETSYFIVKVYKRLYPVIEDENPKHTTGENCQAFMISVAAFEGEGGRPMKKSGKDLLLVLKKYVESRAPDLKNFGSNQINIFNYMMCLQRSKTYFLKGNLVLEPEHFEMPYSIEAEMEDICNFLGGLLKHVLPEQENPFRICVETLLTSQFATCRHLSDMIADKMELSDPYNPATQSLNRFFYTVTEEYIAGNKKRREESIDPLPARDMEDIIDGKTFRKILDTSIEQKQTIKLCDGRYIVYAKHCAFDRNTSVVFIKELDQ